MCEYEQRRDRHESPKKVIVLCKRIKFAVIVGNSFSFTPNSVTFFFLSLSLPLTLISEFQVDVRVEVVVKVTVVVMVMVKVGVVRKKP